MAASSQDPRGEFSDKHLIQAKVSFFLSLSLPLSLFLPPCLLPSLTRGLVYFRSLLDSWQQTFVLIQVISGRQWGGPKNAHFEQWLGGEDQSSGSPGFAQTKPPAGSPPPRETRFKPIYIYIYIYKWICISLSLSLFLSLSLYICIYVYMYICIYVYIYIYIYVSLSLYIYIYIHMYIHT